MGLIDLDAPLERDPVIEAYKRHVDRTLLRENLTLSVEQRVEKLQRALALVEQAKRAAFRPKDLEAIAELEALEDERGELS